MEIDVDLEAYPAHGAYLWGAWSPEDGYVPHVTWAPPGPDGLGGTAEAENFARFWDWLMERRAAAVGAGRTFRAYCWAAEGENHWLRHSAKRFEGMEFVVDGPQGAHVLDVPTIGEVEKFISSDEGVDLFRVTKKQLISPEGLGLKVVAPLAGFAWRDEDADGEACCPSTARPSASSAASGGGRNAALQRRRLPFHRRRPGSGLRPRGRGHPFRRDLDGAAD